jgi:hypothetical protein
LFIIFIIYVFKIHINSVNQTDTNSQGRSDPGVVEVVTTPQSSKILFFLLNKIRKFFTFVTKKNWRLLQIAKFDFLVQKISLQPPNVPWLGPALGILEIGGRFGVGFVVVVGFCPILADGTFWSLSMLLLLSSVNGKNISLYTEKRKETITMDGRTNIYHALDLDYLSCWYIYNYVHQLVIQNLYHMHIWNFYLYLNNADDMY